MADINSSAFSENDSDNNTVDQPSWPENQAPNTVNDAARALQGALKRWANHVNCTQTSTGTADHYVLTYGIGPVELVKGDRYSWIVHETNTLPISYLQINSLPSYPIYYGQNYAAPGMLSLNMCADVAWDGNQWQLLNPHQTAVSLPSDITASTVTTSGNLNVGGIAQVNGDLNVLQDIAATGNVSSVTGAMTGYTVAATTSVSGATLASTGAALVGTDLGVGGTISLSTDFWLGKPGSVATINFAPNTYINFSGSAFQFVISGVNVGHFP